jgi:hypothetical protein
MEVTTSSHRKAGARMAEKNLLLDDLYTDSGGFDAERAAKG